MTFWVSAAIGWLIIGWGIRGLLHHHVDTRPANLARFFVGGALVHDLIAAPLVLAVGVIVSRMVPPPVRAPIQGGLIVSGIVMLFSWPFVRDYARILHNPSSLPHNYTANLLLVLGAVWLVVAALCIARARHRGPT